MSSFDQGLFLCKTSDADRGDGGAGLVGSLRTAGGARYKGSVRDEGSAKTLDAKATETRERSAFER